MTQKEFSFCIAQVENIIGQCRHKFKSKRHQDCYNNLLQLFQAVKSKYKSFGGDDLDWCKENVLFLVYTGIEFLDYKRKKTLTIKKNE